MLLRNPPDPLGFIEPCAPVLYEVAPAGPDWLHEIKHDGWRIIARKDGDRVRLWSRNGRDWTADFPGIVTAIAHLPNDRLVLDGEAAGHAPDGLPDFHALQSPEGRAGAFSTPSTSWCSMARISALSPWIAAAICWPRRCTTRWEGWP
jgi:ATP-dependent DNA ligase